MARVLFLLVISLFVSYTNFIFSLCVIRNLNYWFVNFGTGMLKMKCSLIRAVSFAMSLLVACLLRRCLSRYRNIISHASLVLFIAHIDERNIDLI